MKFKVRRARPEDARGIIDAHRRSIREVCNADYTSEQIDAWSGRDLQESRRRDSIENSHVDVVEGEDGEIYGFCHHEAYPDQSERYVIKGLFLCPEALGKGLGRAMMERAEVAAKRADSLQMVVISTLTARAFYQRQGFHTLEEKNMPMQNIELRCVKMSKDLAHRLLHPFNPIWRDEFERLRSAYHSVLGDSYTRIEHVGSTAIVGIRAKPILDIDIVIASQAHFQEVREKLEMMGYKHNGDQGIAGREVFKRLSNKTPKVDIVGEWMNHHLYVCVEGSRELVRHTLFRDALNKDASLRREYERIKVGIESRANGDRKIYADIKENAGPCSEFVERTIRMAEHGGENFIGRTSGDG